MNKTADIEASIDIALEGGPRGSGFGGGAARSVVVIKVSADVN